MGPRAPLIALALAALCVLSVIALQGRPVALADGPVGPDGAFKLACVSYAPYGPGQTPFDETLVIPPEQIERDMTVLTGLTRCVRTYSMGQGLDRVVDIAGRHGLTVYAGAWIGRDADANAREVARLIEVANAHPKVLKGVVVGNEVLLRGDQPAAALEGYIRQVRAGVPARVPVTYADVWEFWMEHPELRDAVDLVTVHILPYWEDAPTAVDDAVAHVMAVWGEVRDHFAPKPILIGETGWPSQGRRREAAEPGLVEQEQFLRGFLRAAHEAGAAYNVIEAFDQPWKRALEGTVGGAWGVFDAWRQPKVTLAGPVVERPDAGAWLAGALVLGLLPLAVAVVRRESRDGATLGLLAAGGWLIAGTVVLQLWHAQAASRGWMEWAVNGGWLVVGTTIALVALRGLAGLPCPLTRLSACFEPDRLRLLVVAAMAVATLGLLFESRYRDMPVSMFLGLALLLAFVPAAHRPRQARVLAGVLAAAGVGVLLNEGVSNTHAWAWTATSLLLAAPLLRPARD